MEGTGDIDPELAKEASLSRRQRLELALKRYESKEKAPPVYIPPPSIDRGKKKVSGRQGLNFFSSSSGKKEMETGTKKPIVRNSRRRNRTMEPGEESSDVSRVLHIKRKREEEALDVIVLERDERSKKRSLMSSLTENFAALSTKKEEEEEVEGEGKKKEQEEVEEEKKETEIDVQNLFRVFLKDDKKETKKKERKLFRLAYTITDSSKAKAKEAHRIQADAERSKIIAQRREETKGLLKKKEGKEEEEYVVDVYHYDPAAAAQELLEADVVRLESFNEDLVFEGEYDEDTATDSDDFDAESHPWNDYPEEEESPDECSDDLSGEELSNKRTAHPSSEDEYGFQPYSDGSEEMFEEFAYEEDEDYSDVD